ncbi:MAG: hypothetical protein ABIH72_03650 [archaeon]
MMKKFYSISEICLLVISIFAIAYILSSGFAVVSAQETSVCCEKTSYGAWCQNSESASCNSNYRSSPTSCDATSFCREGCCYDGKEGLCMENTPERVCIEKNGTWSEGKDCNIAQCELGCCILANEAALVTLTRCKRISAFYGLNTNFRTNVQDEDACIEMAHSQDKGACVYETDYIRSCKFVTRQQCDEGLVGSDEGTVTGNITFHKDWLCSAEELATNCGKSSETICVSGLDEVYFIDTCGNPANIYDASKINDDLYWKKVYSKDESCGAGSANANSAGCGNCDYFYGSICRAYDRSQDSTRPSYGESICRDLDCEKTYNGQDFNHGESWCMYDGTATSVGDEDANAVGAREWRHICISNEEIVEPCADFRQEVCWQGGIETDHGLFSQAGCVANRWQDCIFQGEQDDCENTDKRDCEWIGSIAGKNMSCVPSYSPGLDFYSTKGDAQGVCSQASAVCVVEFEKKIYSDEDCTKNCECLDESWQNQMKELCASMGDCDGKVNYLGEDGYDEGYDLKISKIKTDFILPAVRLLSGGVGGLVGLVFGVGGVKGADGGGVAITADKVTFGENKIIAEGSVTTAPSTTPGPASQTSPANTGGGLGNLVQPGTAGGVLVASLGWGMFVGGLLYMGASMMGASEEMSKALGAAGFAAGFSARLLSSPLAGSGGWSQGGLGIGQLSAGGAIAGIAIGIIVFIILYEEVTQKKVIFTCETWEAPVGGHNCEECNGDPFRPCSEYRCKSLGQACELLNAGSIGNESCVWINPHDVNSPTITPWEDALSLDHSYTNVDTRPPSIGMQITSQETRDGCIKAFTPITFGLMTNEPAQCKIDYNHTKDIESMSYYFGETNLYLYNHTQRLSLPGASVLEGAENPLIQPDGTYTLYTRCQDANGNVNDDEFAIRFCVEAGPDLTPPVIYNTSIISGMPVAYNTSQVYFELYVNEPSECKWSRENKDYDVMENSFACSTRVWEMGANLLYKCSSTLTGIQDRVENKFYFRCKDQPGKPEGDRNENRQSFEFTLLGTQPLDILSYGPNETISGGTDIFPVYLEIVTDNGCCDGDAFCFYSTTGQEKDWIMFFDTRDYTHQQRQDLPEGDYHYYFKCTDLGGNTDFADTEFTVKVDREAPTVVRVYQDTGPSKICGNAGCLKIITDEDSDCSYSTSTCNFNFNEGIQMPYSNTTEHYAEWNTDFSYYIKCRDTSGKQPNPSECSIIARGYNE